MIIPRKKNPNRREFLKISVAGWFAAAGLPIPAWCQMEPDDPAPRGNFRVDGINHRGHDIKGIHSYADRLSVSAGERINFRVSSSAPYQMRVSRLGWSLDDTSQDQVLTESFHNQHVQQIRPGSFVHIDNPIQPGQSLEEFTAECWVRPSGFVWYGGLISQYEHNHQGTFNLAMDPEGRVSFFLGDGGFTRRHWNQTTDDPVLQEREWSHVAATWDGSRKKIYVNDELVGDWPYIGDVVGCEQPIRIASYGGGGAANFFNGDIAMPTIYSRALDAAEISERFQDRGLTVPTSGVIGVWPFDEERGDHVHDASGNDRPGKIINQGTWMIGGPSDDVQLERYEKYDPGDDESRGHSLRFAMDDLYDCGWEDSNSFVVPHLAEPGMYMAHFIANVDGVTNHSYTSFVVRENRRLGQADVVVLTSHNTWQAYNTSPFGRVTQDGPFIPQEFEHEANAPRHSLYQGHRGRDGSLRGRGNGTYQTGFLKPNPLSSPFARRDDYRYGHLLAAERPLHVWLEQEGFEYDMMTDVDLHLDPRKLSDYKVLIIAGHNEYWSDNMYSGIQEFLREGGNVINMSGNTGFWRVSYNRDGTIMECRKTGASGGQVPADRIHEAWHSQDGEKGGLMRDVGLPAHLLLGMDTFGWFGAGDISTYSADRITNSNHFLFTSPVDLGVVSGQTIGQAEGGGFPRINGHEFDIRVSTIARSQTVPIPHGAPIPSIPQGIELLASGNRLHGGHDYWLQHTENEAGGEIIYWDRPEGGRVFNTGSINTALTMAHDPLLAGLVRNILSHFGVEPGERGDRTTYHPADFNGDGYVNLADFTEFVDAFNSGVGDDNYLRVYDLNNDGRVDFTDFFLFVEHFGRGPDDPITNGASKLASRGLPEIFSLHPELHEAAMSHSALKQAIDDYLHQFEDGREPLTYALHQNGPNPFNASTTIRYSIADVCPVRLEVFNGGGQVVRRLVTEVQLPGTYQVQWDSRDERGRGVASGLYFSRIEAGRNFVATNKMMLVK